MSGVKQNSPFRRGANGTATIVSGDISVTVTHNLGATTKLLAVNPLNEYGIDSYITDVTVNAFTINIIYPQPLDATFNYGVAA